MKLSHIKIENFLGARFIDVKLETPITLFFGSNGAGKSSIQEALRIGLVGESVRVDLKKDAGQLVSSGAESGCISVELFDGVNVWIELPSWNSTKKEDYAPPAALSYVLNAQKFASLTTKERRSFLFGLMGIKLSQKDIVARLIAMGCNEHVVNEIAPMLRSGFEAACKQATENAAESRSEWKAITKEVYGEKKAANWEAQKVEFNPQELIDWRNKLPVIDEFLVKLREAKAAKKNEGLIHDLARELDAILREVLTTKPNHKLGYSSQKVLNKYIESYGEISKQKPESDDAAEVNEAILSGAVEERNEIVAKIKELEDLECRATKSDEVTAEALAAHQSVLDWIKISEALSPNGIPGELLKQSLEPINDRLNKTSIISGFAQSYISDTMDIYVDFGIEEQNMRQYHLLSESEKWRVDAMIAEAISYISGVKILMLDRFDVLDLKGRSALLGWLNTLAENGDINNALIFGTLKQKPQLPETMTAFWIESGMVKE